MRCWLGSENDVNVQYPCMSVERLTDLLVSRAHEFVSLPGSKPVILGLSGPQGAGKTTTTRALERSSGLKVAALSIDDFYLPLTERARMAEEVSPLFRVRGPAGSHDLALLKTTIEQLLAANDKSAISAPVFDKRTDNRLPSRDWKTMHGRPDVILVEGWLVGAIAPPDFVSGSPMNDVERSPGGDAWRAFQQDQLEGPYFELFKMIDGFVHLTTRSFEHVYQWRLEQEAETQNISVGELSEASVAWVASFIQHFQRLTCSMIDGYRFDGTVIKIDAQRQILL